MQVALITGANKGIGYAVAESLMARPNMHVVLGCRDVGRGRKAAEKLSRGNISPPLSLIQLDVADERSIAAAAKTASQTVEGLDILVNNAGIAVHTEEVTSPIASQILQTNYFGAASVCRYFIPLLRQDGRIVNISSVFAGQTFRTMSSELKEKFLQPTLTWDALDALMHSYLEDVAANRWEEKGWPKGPYGVSKIGLSFLTQVLARMYPHLIVSHCCPGYVKTDMTEHKGIRSPEKAAETVVYCSLLDPGTPSGVFYRDCRTRPWPG
jgi:carbonyl reductase 1